MAGHRDRVQQERAHPLDAALHRKEQYEPEWEQARTGGPAAFAAYLEQLKQSYEDRGQKLLQLVDRMQSEESSLRSPSVPARRGRS